MIDIKRLSYFVQVAEDRSLSKASESLCIAQPALSRQIHLLEDYLGFPLFVRTSRGMKLTREGEFLHGAVVNPLRDLEIAVQKMRSPGLETESDIAIDVGVGFYPALAHVAGKLLIDTFERDFSNINLRIIEAQPETLLTWLEAGTIDFALLDQPCPAKNIQNRLLAMEELDLVCAEQTHSAKQRGTVNLRKLADLPLILPAPHSGVRQVLDAAAKKSGVSLHIPYEIDLLSVRIDLLVEGEGYGLMPRSLARHLASELPLRSIRLSKPGLQTGIYLATRSSGEAESNRISKIDSCIQKMIIDLIG